MEERGAVASPVQPGAMILPLPAIQITGESRYVRSMASVMFGALLLQSLGVTLRMFILLDIFGGFMIGLCVALGWYAWSKDMDLQLICFCRISLAEARSSLVLSLASSQSGVSSNVCAADRMQSLSCFAAMSAFFSFLVLSRRLIAQWKMYAVARSLCVTLSR
eukprot:TRINITY_DN5442_c0_g1_i2.p1 TRINITY_DN5442_c0_g1~~TRINITY_DN5442_c0_g1_i2.p1  ORF type:complete len:173 (-),score=13.65 TRINITY_DN5442_c0_g1_i2:249-737(-)